MLKFFFDEINKKHHSIKFVKKYSKSEIVFLDVLIRKDEQQSLETTIFKKKIDRQSYLQAKSDNSSSHKKYIPYSEILRVKRFCSTNSKFE